MSKNDRAMGVKQRKDKASAGRGNAASSRHAIPFRRPHQRQPRLCVKHAIIIGEIRWFRASIFNISAFFDNTKF
jgi:hypothetical protein